MQAIIEKILFDAKEEAKLIKAEARKEKKRILTEVEKEAVKLRDELVREGKRKADLEAEGLIREKKIELNKKRLKFKRQKLEKVFDAALEKLLKLSDKEKKKIIYSMILRLAEGGEEVIVAPKERQIYEGSFLERLNQQLKKSGKEPLRLSNEERELKGGFILKKGNFEINASFEVLFSYMAEREVRRVTKVLFGEEVK